MGASRQSGHSSSADGLSSTVGLGMADGMGRPTEQQTGNVDQLAFTRGFFTQDAGGSLVDIFTVAGIVDSAIYQLSGSGSGAQLG